MRGVKYFIITFLLILVPRNNAQTISSGTTSSFSIIRTLRRPVHPRFMDIFGANNNLHGLAWSRDGTRLASYDDFNGASIAVWALNDGADTTLRRPNAMYLGRSIAFTSNRDELIVPSGDSEPVNVALEVYSINLNSISGYFLKDRVFASVQDNKAQFFAVSKTGDIVAIIFGQSEVHSVALYSTATRQFLGYLEGSSTNYASFLQDVAFSVDGSMVSVSRLDGRVLIYSVATRVKLLEISAYTAVATGRARAMTFSPDGKYIAIGTGSSVTYHRDNLGRAIPDITPDPIRVFELASGKCVAKYVGLGQPILGMAWLSSENYIAFVIGDNMVRFWDPQHPDTLLASMTLAGPLSDISISPLNGEIAVTNGSEVTLIALTQIR